jgi:hypothetical protein
MNYDPNMTLSGRMAKQTVKLTFQMWESKAEIIEVVGGNCTGLTVIDCAVGNAYEGLDLDHYGDTEIILNSPDGGTLSCSDDGGRGDDWLKDMLVKAEIVEIKKDGV